MQWLMLQQEKPDDFVIATGEQHSIRDFVNAAACELEILLEWRGTGMDEKAYDERGNCVVSIDPRYLRPSEVDTLVGDAAKARAKLGWHPRVTFTEMIREMVAADLRVSERDALVKRSGYTVLANHE
jgi:GDPmannose 4,6-dehydratase